MANKKEMKKELKEKYGYEEKELKDEKGGELVNSALEKMLEEEENKATKLEEPTEKPQEKVEEEPDEDEDDGLFTIDESLGYSVRQIPDNELIMCMSGVSGQLVLIGEDGKRKQAKDFGQIIKIRYADLSYIHNVSYKAFEEGKIIVLNKEVQEEFGLEDYYKNVITPKNIDKILKLSAQELDNFMKKMPKGMQSALFERARKKYKARQINDRNVIEVIEDNFGVSLETGSKRDGRIQVETE